MSVWQPLRSATLAMAAMALVLSAVTIGSPALARADVCVNAQVNVPLPLEVGPCADVLAQEARWLTAITAGDRATVEAILGPTFKHIDSEGQLFDRAKEVDGTTPLPFTMNPSEQIVDIARDTAVIHGVNTLIEDGKVLTRERFTDVFVLQDGVWKAVSAQETKL
ncbi:MAG: hypothetical protein QOF31_228 [Mycobacterium sp.]|nr:hypothetical protein [Mycobacterium sp.]